VTQSGGRRKWAKKTLLRALNGTHIHNEFVVDENLLLKATGILFGSKNSSETVDMPSELG